MSSVFRDLCRLAFCDSLIKTWLSFLPFFRLLVLLLLLKICVLQPPEGALFAEPRLFRACVPPGMHRFRGNYWESESLPIVRQKLGYPLPEGDTNPDEAAARRTELELGLQVSTSSFSRKCYIFVFLI